MQNSKNFLNRSLKVIPTASQTYSKSHRYFTKPLFAKKGKGQYLWATDGKKYLDFNMALGSVILGYKPPQWYLQGVPDGINFSLPHPMETELAEKLCSIIPCAQKIKFFKNGSDAVEIAVRLARAYIGKEDILWMSYHGFHDSFIASTKPAKGIPIGYKTNNYHYNTIGVSINPAAIVIEPSHVDIIEIAEYAKKNNIILILDEVLTGFRHGMSGLGNRLGIKPDLICLGKCMANGLPLSAVAGRADIMNLLDEGVFGSSTFGGETLSIAVAIHTIKEFEYSGNYLWKIGSAYIANIDKTQVSKFGVITGLPPRCGIEFKDLYYKSFFQDEMLKRGFIVNGLSNFCLAHTFKDISLYIEATNEVLEIMGKRKYHGKIIKPMFKR